MYTVYTNFYGWYIYLNKFCKLKLYFITNIAFLMIEFDKNYAFKIFLTLFEEQYNTHTV